MNNKNGISMISLIVTIACIILLSSLSIGTGVKYLRESKSKDKENFIQVLSSAVSRREQETNLDSISYPYLGYHVSDSKIFEEIFSFKIGNVPFESGIWYVVDKDSAASLGVKNSENYVSGVEDSESGTITVALVNYMTGDVYLIDMSSADVKNLDLTKEDITTGHEHVKNIDEATCTEEVKCIYCGYVFQEALGHTYSTELSIPQAYDAVSHYNKVCTRCEMPGGYDEHTFKYKSNVDGTSWYHKKYCTVCGWNSAWNESDGKEACTIQYSLPTSDTQKMSSHIKMCIVCGQKVTENHEFTYRYVSEAEHERYCEVEGCGYVVAKERHVDSNSDNLCDECGHDIVNYGYPQLVSVVYYKSGASSDEDKYYAKFGDTIAIDFTADRQIQNLDVKIAGHSVPEKDIKSVGDNAWEIRYELDDALIIPDGKLSFNITCESTSGVVMSPVTIPTDKKYVTFDGTAPSMEYIEKKNLAQ